MDAIKTAKILKVKIRTNTVIVRHNYETLLEIAGLLEKLHVDAANFLIFNRTAEAEKAVTNIDMRYSEIAPRLKVMVDSYGSRIKKITIREMPFCMMTGYERNVTNLLQLQYDPDEWNYLVRYGGTYGLGFTIKALVKGSMQLPRQRRFPYVSLHTTKHEGIMKYRAMTSKVKGPQCYLCQYDLICDGLWKEYARLYDFNELKPVPGEKITDPAYFIEL